MENIMGQDRIVSNISTRYRCSLPRCDEVRKKGFEAVGQDFGDNFVGEVAKIVRVVLVYGGGVRTFWDEGNEGVVHLRQ